jgi:hypothetical protein
MRTIRRVPRLLAAALPLLLAACGRDGSTTEPAEQPSTADIFTDAFAKNVDFQAFQGSKLDAVSIDATTKQVGTSSLKIIVPGPNDATGGYAGGALVTSIARDLTKYNAITFWAKASVAAKLNVIGTGNDNTGTSQYWAEQAELPLTTTWTKYTLPLPLASKLSAEKGLFHFAEGHENNAGYTIWLDDLKFETLTTITTPRPTIPTATVSMEIGGTARVEGSGVTFAVGGVDQKLTTAPAYFTYTSSAPAVATVSTAGVITAVSAGTAQVTATLGSTAATGTVTVTAVAAPAAAAPTPATPAGDVIALFSGPYTNRAVDTWSATWDQADVADVQLGGNATKKYTNLVFAGIEFTSAPIDARAMTHLHLDVYGYDDASLKVKLVDFGANGAFGGGDDTEHEVSLSPTSTPKLLKNAWSSLDIPLAAFTGMTGRGKVAQMILSGSSRTLYVDNVYFWKVPGPLAPTVAAPTPTVAAANVVSLFSNAYPNVPVGTWSAGWDQADLADVQVAGNDTKKYTNLVFAGIEFTSPTVNASTMTHFHMDVWTPDSTAAPKAFKVKLVDFGPNGTFGGGDDKEHEVSVTRAGTPSLVTGSWVSIDLPLSAFSGMTTRGAVAQMILSGDLSTVYVDNVYFYRVATAQEPAVAAPTPTYPAADVLSLFSNAYTNVPVDTWSAGWDQADVTDVAVAGNATKKYTNLVFAGIEFTTTRINASAMTHFRMDLWTPDATAAPAAFRVKLVDFGANGAFGGGDDVEHELSFSASSTPALATGSWVTLDIPLTRFTGLVTKGNLAQLIISGDPKTVFVDNVLLHK